MAAKLVINKPITTYDWIGIPLSKYRVAVYRAKEELVYRATIRGDNYVVEIWKPFRF